MQKTYLRVITDDSVSLTNTSQEIGVFQLAAGSLHAVAESLCVGDAERINITDLRVNVRLFSYTNDPTKGPFSAFVVLAQSAGTPSFGAHNTQSELAVMIDQMFDDEVGYNIIFEPKFARRLARFWDGTNGLLEHVCEFDCQLSKKHLRLLNREIQTERLQDLYLLVIVRGDNTIDIYKSESITIKYSHVAKELTIR